MTIITISRQMGSQGDELAAELARRLGWRCLCREVINQAAVDAGVPLVALADIDELGFLGLRPRQEEWQAYQAQVERIIHRLAEEENAIIVGRGSQVALRSHPRALHLRVVAPLETRLTRFQAREQISPEAARARLDASDRARNRYLRRSYGVALDDPTLYHLVINTGLVQFSQAIALVLQAVHQLSYEPD